MSAMNLENSSSSIIAAIDHQSGGPNNHHHYGYQSGNSTLSLFENSIHHHHNHHQPRQDLVIVSDADADDDEQEGNEAITMRFKGTTVTHGERQMMLNESSIPSSSKGEESPIPSSSKGIVVNNNNTFAIGKNQNNNIHNTIHNNERNQTEVNGIFMADDSQTQILKEILVPGPSTALLKLAPHQQQSSHRPCSSASPNALRDEGIAFPRDSPTPLSSPTIQQQREEHEDGSTAYNMYQNPQQHVPKYYGDGSSVGDVATIRDSTTVGAQKRFLSMMMTHQVRKEPSNQESRKQHTDDRVWHARKESNSTPRRTNNMVRTMLTSGHEETTKKRIESSHHQCYPQNNEKALLNHHQIHQHHQTNLPSGYSQASQQATTIASAANTSSSILPGPSHTHTNTSINMNTAPPFFPNTQHHHHQPFRGVVVGPMSPIISSTGRDRITYDDYATMEQLHHPPLLEMRPRARSRAIAIQRPSIINNNTKAYDESDEHMYDYATWRMYHRIVDHRRTQRFRSQQFQQQEQHHHHQDDGDDHRSPRSSKADSVLVEDDTHRLQANHHSMMMMMMIPSNHHHHLVDPTSSGSSSCSDDEIFDLEL